MRGRSTARPSRTTTSISARKPRRRWPTPLPWSTTRSRPRTCLPNVRLLLVPTLRRRSAHGPFERNVSLTVTHSGGGDCTVTRPSRSSATSRTRGSRKTSTPRPIGRHHDQPAVGRIVDEHIYWHQFVGGGPRATGSISGVARLVPAPLRQWREFGYKKVTPWYPGRPLPTGPEFDRHGEPAAVYSPTTTASRPGSRSPAGPERPGLGGRAQEVADFASVNEFTNAFEGTFHGQVHCNIGAGSGGASSAPAGRLRQHVQGQLAEGPDVLALARLHRSCCTAISARHPGFMCRPSPADPSADPWMADNAADTRQRHRCPPPAPTGSAPTSGTGGRR